MKDKIFIDNKIKHMIRTFNVSDKVHIFLELLCQKQLSSIRLSYEYNEVKSATKWEKGNFTIIFKVLVTEVIVTIVTFLFNSIQLKKFKVFFENLNKVLCFCKIYFLFV